VILSEILASQHIQVNMNNALLKIQSLTDHFRCLECRIFDPLLAAWLLNPDKPTLSLPLLVTFFYNYFLLISTKLNLLIGPAVFP